MVSSSQPLDSISYRIQVIRGDKVILDSDLAELYGVPTKRLNEQSRRNPSRFPPDFIFQLTDHEFSRLKSQIATSNARAGRGGRRYQPFAFTEHGALMAANLLNSPRAIEASVYVVRAFVRLRQTLAAHKELAAKLELLERKAEILASKHDGLSAETRAQFRQVIQTLRELMSAPVRESKPIGFVTPK